MENNSLKKRVMTQIYFEYYKSIFWGHVEIILPVMAIGSSLFFFSVIDVARNMPTDDMGSIYKFFLAAARDTSMVVKGLFSIALASTLYGLLKATLRINPKVYSRIFRLTSFRY